MLKYNSNVLANSAKNTTKVAPGSCCCCSCCCCFSIGVNGGSATAGATMTPVPATGK